MIKWAVYTVGAITLSLLASSYLTTSLFPASSESVYQTFIFMALAAVGFVVLEVWYFITELV